MLLKYFTLVFLVINSCLLCAQNDDTAANELLENYFRDNETASESEAQQFLENLDNLRNNPLNLNKATREELSGLYLLNEIQLNSFLSYREKFGSFLNEFELQAVPNLDVTDIRRLLQFADVNGNLNTRNTNLIQGLYKGENEVLMRWSQPQDLTPIKNAEGSNNAFAVRYRHSFDNRIRFGFTAENDPGEAFFAKSNRNGFDFYSAHLFIQNLNARVKAIALGDYTARLGQGLLLQSGFSPGKSSETVNVTRNTKKLNAYGAFGEVFFLRGAAATIEFKNNIEVTAIYSNRRKDGNIQFQNNDDLEQPELVFTALQTNGLHRTASEVEDEKSLREQMGGISVGYNGKFGHITANGLYIEYDKAWTPNFEAYRRYAFTGKSLFGASLDYNLRRRNFTLFGETARSDNGGMAAVNGLLFSASRNVILTAVHRHLEKDYQAVYAAPFAETSGFSNEQGLYLGTDIRWTRRWQINLYADVWKHPWLRFGTDAPSNGREYLARILWQKGRNFSVYTQIKLETKERTEVVNGIRGLYDNQRNVFRIHAVYKLASALEMRSRMEWTTFQIDNEEPSNGFMMYQEAIIKPLGSPVSGALRYGVFDTDNFETRAFAFENDLFSAVSIPAFSGRGRRYYANIQWRINKVVRLEGRLEHTDITTAVTSTSVTGSITTWKLQMRLKF